MERRTYIITGQKASAEEFFRLIQTGQSEQILYRLLWQASMHERLIDVIALNVLVSAGKLWRGGHTQSRGRRRVLKRSTGS